MPRTLLLADDNATVQRVVALTCAGQDIDVVAVADGEQAIARITASRPDIVLADIGMPKRSGYEVAAFVKRDPGLRHIPVLLLAGAFEPVDAARAEQAGCDGVLVKPFEPQYVLARVRELMAGARGSAAQVAVADVPRPIERLIARPVPAPSDAIPELAPTRKPQQQPAASADDYFDRLDAALSTGAHAKADLKVGLYEASATPRPKDDLKVGLYEASATPRSKGDEEDGPVPTLDAVLSGAAGPKPAVDDALVDEVTRRVLERLRSGGRP